jgi:hypothetical protein
MVRKRARGGGRKPKGPIAARAQLTVRMPDDLRSELEAAAQRRGRNLTDELLGRLRASFARERDRQRDPPLRAWCFLISELASYIHYETPNWHKNPFWFRAFKLGVAGLLDALEPRGEVRPPKDLDPAIDHETPEAQAKAALNIVFHQLHGGKSREYAHVHSIAGIREDHDPEVLDQRIAAALDNRLAAALADLDFDRDAYAQVRRDLQLKPIWRKGG